MAKEKDDLFSIRAAVEDVKAAYARQGEQVQTGREIGKTILSSVSIIISILGASNILQQTADSSSTIRPIFLIIAGASFVGLICFCLLLLLPNKFYGPIDSTAEVYEIEIIGKCERDVLLKLLSSYIHVVNLNECSLKRRLFYTWAAGALMIIVVICMIGTLIVR
jgi:hypothetical protein